MSSPLPQPPQSPSQPTEKFLKFVEDAKRLKEDEVVTDPTDPDLPTTVHVYRDGNPIAMMASAPDREVLMEMLRGAILGYSADEVLCVFETYKTIADINPSTGAPWQSGEMQQLTDEHPELASQTVKECLMLGRWTPVQEENAMATYEIKDGKVEWLGTDFPSENLGGHIKEFVDELWKKETIHDNARVHFNGTLELSEEAARAHTDIATTKHLNSYFPMVVALLAKQDGSERTAILERAERRMKGEE